MMSRLAAGVTAQGLARRHASRSAQWMAVMFAVLGLSMAAQGLSLWLSSDALPIFKPDLLFMVTMLLSLASGVSVNIAFIGLALDQAGARARQQQAALEALRQTQQAMELAARTREAVAGERARTTRLLAHEVRQPLHNASVALQSGAATLANSRNAADAARAIEQAQSVIRRVSTTLDNTVAATTLLATQQRISTADTDLQMLIELCLGDLPPQARARVQIDYRADARSARLEASLMRLALRNLLINATLYAPDPTPVQLRVLDSDTPLALVLEVADLGPGIADELRDRLFDDGVRGAPATVPGYGLGLHVVKRVAQLHGGSVDWLPNAPQGSVFRLTLPQGDPA
jgi:signal transduction histidine kinase